MWNPLQYLRRTKSANELDAQHDLLLKQAPIPCLWLFGKTGSGKTSLIRYLTGADDAEIGSGFRPKTRQSRMFDFPDDELPIVQFLDTRGLGEAAYDETEDIARIDPIAHLLIVTVRATDQAAAAVIDPLRAIRKKNPERPILLVITCLHDAYPGQQHLDPDPFSLEPRPLPADIPETLSRCLSAQYERFDGLFDRAVPVDLTRPADGFESVDYGGERLKQTILDMLPAAYRQTLLQMDHVRGELRKRHWRRSERMILAHSVVAASAAAVPLPWIDIPVVMATQSNLLHRLAIHHRQKMDTPTVLKFSGVLGGRLAIRMGIRELLKFIPWVGSTVNAAAAFAFTYGSGEAASWYFREVKAGHVPTSEELREIFKDRLQAGAELWKTTREDAP